MATLSAQARREIEVRLDGRTEEVCLSCGGALKDSSKSPLSLWPGPGDVMTRTDGR